MIMKSVKNPMYPCKDKVLQPASCCGSRPTNGITNMANYRVLLGMGLVIWSVGQPNQMLIRRPEEVTNGKNESGALLEHRFF